MDNSIAWGMVLGGVWVVILSGYLMGSLNPGSVLFFVLKLAVWVGLMISALGAFLGKGTVLGNAVVKGISVVAMVASAILFWGVIFTRSNM